MHKLIPILLVAATGGVITTGEVHAADCSVDSYLVQTDSSQTSGDVECLQQSLNDSGYDSGPVDGWFGPITEAAVTAYQSALGLTVDGQVGSETAGSLGVWGSGDSNESASSSESSGSSDPQSDGDVPDDQYPNLGGSCSEWSDDALAVGWSADQWDTLSYIMVRESGCNPSAYNPSGASGLLQIMPMWADDCGGGDLFDPWFNLSCGLHVYHVQGWTAWSTY